MKIKVRGKIVDWNFSEGERPRYGAPYSVIAVDEDKRSVILVSKPTKQAAQKIARSIRAILKDE